MQLTERSVDMLAHCVGSQRTLHGKYVDWHYSVCELCGGTCMTVEPDQDIPGSQDQNYCKPYITTLHVNLGRSPPKNFFAHSPTGSFAPDDSSITHL
jgi:hypothetical protein